MKNNLLEERLMLSFKELGVSQEITESLKKRGIKEPTPVQEESIELIKNGEDVIVEAPTGTGKTLAFLLPVFENIKMGVSHIQTVIITPTRELALQIAQEAEKLSKVKSINILSAYGGKEINGQLDKVDGNIDMVIGTPGRILDYIKRKLIKLDKISNIILDEADEMLLMGFRDDVEEIFKSVAKNRQTMCFSATMNPQVKKLAYKVTKEAKLVIIDKKENLLKNVTQFVVDTSDKRKVDALCHVMNENNPFMAIIFCRTKNRVDELEEELYSRGYSCQKLHGDLPQAKREKVMASFKKTEIQYLVATDVAARGLDIGGVTHVYNYDLPDNVQTYVHRIGRTGRAGKNGETYLFVTQFEMPEFKEIEKSVQGKIIRKTVHHEIDVKCTNILPETKYIKRINTNIKKYDPEKEEKKIIKKNKK